MHGVGEEIIDGALAVEHGAVYADDQPELRAPGHDGLDAAEHGGREQHAVVRLVHHDGAVASEERVGGEQVEQPCPRPGLRAVPPPYSRPRRRACWWPRGRRQTRPRCGTSGSRRPGRGRRRGARGGPGCSSPSRATLPQRPLDDAPGCSLGTPGCQNAGSEEADGGGGGTASSLFVVQEVPRLLVEPATCAARLAGRFADGRPQPHDRTDQQEGPYLANCCEKR